MIIFCYILTMLYFMLKLIWYMGWFNKTNRIKPSTLTVDSSLSQLMSINIRYLENHTMNTIVYRNSDLDEYEVHSVYNYENLIQSFDISWISSKYSWCMNNILRRAWIVFLPFLYRLFIAVTADCLSLCVLCRYKHRETIVMPD